MHSKALETTNDPAIEAYPCWSADGCWIAFTKELPEGNWGAIYLIPSGGGDPRPISSPGDSIDVGAIAFSPDGKRIAFFSEGAIKTMPVQGGTVEILVRDIQNGRHSEMEFSPTGGRIAFTTGRPYVGDTKIRVGQP